MERRHPAVGNVSIKTEGNDEMTKTSISLQDLRRRLYVKAKTEPSSRFWGLYVHLVKIETLEAAYLEAKRNRGAPGSDGETFKAIEERGRAGFLTELAAELRAGTYALDRIDEERFPRRAARSA